MRLFDSGFEACSTLGGIQLNLRVKLGPTPKVIALGAYCFVSDKNSLWRWDAVRPRISVAYRRQNSCD